MSHGLSDADPMFQRAEAILARARGRTCEPPRSIDEALHKAGLGWSVRTPPCTSSAGRPGGTTSGREHAADWVGHGRAAGHRWAPTTRFSNREAFGSLDGLIGSELHSTQPAHSGAAAASGCWPCCPNGSMSGATWPAPTCTSPTRMTALAVTAAVTPIRCVCANTLGFALHRAETPPPSGPSAPARRAEYGSVATRPGR